jgi:hypothetical protein
MANIITYTGKNSGFQPGVINGNVGDVTFGKFKVLIP